MFEKLLSLLPYNPSLAHQMVFYSRRMRDEASIRRTGLVFLVLAFMLQFVAVLSPPQPTVAASTNDLVNGGISSAADASNQCTANTQHYRDILSAYGISCAAVAAGAELTIKSTGQDYYSMGRLPYGSKNPTSGKTTDETPVNVPNAGKLYFRKLSSFDTGASSSYSAIRVRDASGNAYYILHNCGNLVSVGLPSLTANLIGGSLVAPTPKPVTPIATPAPTPTPATPATPATPMCQYNTALPASSPLCFKPCEYNNSIASGSAQCVKPCEYNSTIPSSDSACKPCEQSTSSQDTTACVAVHKSAVNVTQNIMDANNSTAAGGDVITYTLYAQNNGKATVKQFVFQESLSDVLDYADANDLHGGTLGADNTLTWPAVDIAAGQTASEQVTVRVKDSIPQTPTSASDPGHFDLVMTNVYGNTINIKLPGSPAKTVETAAATLPNTGPGTSLFIGAMVVMSAGYFYGRARLLAKESMLAVKELAV